MPRLSALSLYTRTHAIERRLSQFVQPKSYYWDGIAYSDQFINLPGASIALDIAHLRLLLHNSNEELMTRIFAYSSSGDILISQNFRNIHKSPHTLLELPFIDSYATYNVFHYLVDNTQLYGRFVERGTLHYKFGDNWHLVHGNLESRKLVRHGSEYLDKSNVKTSFLWHTYRVPFPLTRGYKTEFIYVNPLDKPTTIKASILRYQNSDKSRKQVLIKELFQLKPREIKILDFNTVTDIYPSFLQLQSKLLVARPLIVQKNGDTITQILHS